MLSYTRLDNGYTFSLKQLSVTYDHNRIRELLPKLRSSDFLIEHLQHHIQSDPFDIFADDIDGSTVTARNPLFQFRQGPCSLNSKDDEQCDIGDPNHGGCCTLNSKADYQCYTDIGDPNHGDCCTLNSNDDHGYERVHIVIPKQQEEIPVPVQHALELTRDDPFALFVECVSGGCPLNRKKYPQLRNFVETEIVRYINESSKDELVLTSYIPSYLTELIVVSQTSKAIILNIIDPKIGELFELIQQSEYNPHADRSELHFNDLCLDWRDTNPQRRNWVDRYLVLILKFLEAVGPRVQLNIYTSVVDTIPPADIFYGIDYIDEIPRYIFDFIEASRKFTIHDGYIVSLRSNGVYSGSVALDVVINRNDPSYESKMHELCNAVSVHQERLDAETHVSLEYHRSVELNDKIYRMSGMSFSKRGTEYNYVTDRHREIKAEHEASEMMFREYMVHSFYKLQKIHQIHGLSTDCSSYVSQHPMYKYLYGLWALIPLMLS